MKGIVVSAGKGTRLGAPCKALVDVKGRPLITYPLDVLVRSGIKESIIVQYQNQVRERMGDEYKGMKLQYVSQNERKGIAHAISLTEELVNGESMAIILGDIIYDGNLKDMISVYNFSIEDLKPFSFVAGMIKTDDLDLIKSSYGIRDNKFVEKPQDTDGLSNLLGTGMYVASSRVFNIFRRQNPSARGELEITDSLNLGNTYPCVISGKYININTPSDLERVW